MIQQPTYTVITDPDELKKFIDWLPELTNDELYYCVLMARGKYCKGIGTFNSDRSHCTRFIVGKDRLFSKIWQTEAPIDSYSVKQQIVPQEALAMYINPNPRSLPKAQNMMLTTVAESIVNKRPNANIYQDALTCIHKSVSRKIFNDFDFDGVTKEQVAPQVKDIINEDAVKIVQTRGGCHVLIRSDKVEHRYKTSWYLKMKSIPGVDITGDTLLPVPGCYQGGFTPKMYNLNECL